MLENAVYSVISPESCAAIIWRDSAKAELAAEALKLTAPDLQAWADRRDHPGAAGGAHEDPDGAAELLRRACGRLEELCRLTSNEVVQQRYTKSGRWAISSPEVRGADTLVCSAETRLGLRWVI